MKRFLTKKKVLALVLLLAFSVAMPSQASGSRTVTRDYNVGSFYRPDACNYNGTNVACFPLDGTETHASLAFHDKTTLPIFAGVKFTKGEQTLSYRTMCGTAEVSVPKGADRLYVSLVLPFPSPITICPVYGTLGTLVINYTIVDPAT